MDFTLKICYSLLQVYDCWVFFALSVAMAVILILVGWRHAQRRPIGPGLLNPMVSNSDRGMDAILIFLTETNTDVKRVVGHKNVDDATVL